MAIRKIFKPLLFFITLILISCNSGYQNENGKWTWISYDEAVGKRQDEVKKADTETFVILENKKYAKDKNYVFFKGRIIEFAEPSSFEIINDNGYSKDSKNAYLDWDIIINSDPSTFLVLDWPYSKDKNNVFCGNLPLNTTNTNEFKVTKIGNGKTSTLKSHFVEKNPEYKWLDSVKVNGIITGEGEGQTETEKFVGYKKKK